VKNLQFSVVISLFNKQESITRAIKSVLNQAYQNIELIVVNDGSTDDSLAELNKIDDDRLNVITQPNQGVSVARNRGVAESNYDYVCFLDADDEWHPEFLTEITALIENNPGCMIYGTSCQRIDDSGVTKSYIYHNDNNAIVNEFYYQYSENPLLINSSNVCVNKRAFLKAGGFPENANYGEDIYLWLTLADMGEVSVSHKILSTIYQDAENRAGDAIKDEVGYHVKYYLGEGIHSIKEKHQKELIKFVIKSAISHALYATLVEKRALARTYAGYIYKKDRILGVLVWISSFSPKFIISMAKTIKNS